MRSGCRRSTRRPDSTSVTTSATTPPSTRCFGTEVDFDRLVAEAHRRGHAGRPRPGDEPHERSAPWFQASRQSREGPFADWYLWRDPAGFGEHGQPLPPNNWVSFFGGPGLGVGAATRPVLPAHVPAPAAGLNWRNPAVEAAQFAMVRDWLDRGVDGFRLDVFNVFLKHPDLVANPAAGGARRRGPARSTSTIATSPTSSIFSGDSGTSSTNTRVGSPSASCSTAARTAPRSSR